MSHLAQFGYVNNPFRTLTPTVANYTGSTQGQGLVFLLSNLIRLSIVIAGLYAFINFILAGFGFLGAGGEPKNITKATQKIWQSLIGLVLVAGSFLLAAVFGILIFNDPYALISLKIYGP